MKLWLIVLFVAFALPAAAAPLPQSTFAYNGGAPLALRTLAQWRDGSVTIRKVQFASPKGGNVDALLMLPQNRTRRGGVLFTHWLGETDAQSTYNEFFADGLTLANRGAVCLLVDAMWSQPHWYDKVRTPETDYANSIKQVQDLRRALDVLLSIPGVDSHRIAYVGHDFGAMYGAVLSGVDGRPRWYVLMAGTTSFSDWYLYAAQPKDKPAYLAQMAPLDPPQYLATSQGQEFLFQYATHDKYIPIKKAMNFVNAAPLPHGVFFYDTDHALKVPAAFTDRIAWLSARLSP